MIEQEGQKKVENTWQKHHSDYKLRISADLFSPHVKNKACIDIFSTG